MFRLLRSLFRKNSDKQVFLFTLVGAGIFAGVLSLWIGMNQSVWFDEAYSILVSKQSIVEIVRLVGLDTHPPLYYILLHFWGGIFGWSELALRFMSVAALVAAITIAGLLARKLFGARIAIGVVLLLMISPLLLRYGFEIRMYAVGMLIGIAATYALVAARQQMANRTKWLVLYGLLVVVGMFTMYSLALLWLGHVAWLLYMHFKHKEKVKNLLTWTSVYAGAAIVFIPWLPTFLKQLTNGALAPIGQPLNLENIIGIASFNIIYKPLFQVDALLTIVLVTALAIIIYALVKMFYSLKSKRDYLVLLASCIGVPVVILVLVSTLKALYVERYLSFAAIAALILVGVALCSLLIYQRTKRTRVAVGIVYGAFLVGCLQLAIAGNFNFQRMQTPTVEKTASSLQCSSDSTLLAADPYVAIELSYYAGDCPVYFFSESETLGGGYAPLSGSRYQIKNMDDLNSIKVTFVYYGEPEQTVPVDSYTKRDHRMYGALNVSDYIVK